MTKAGLLVREATRSASFNDGDWMPVGRRGLQGALPEVTSEQIALADLIVSPNSVFRRPV